MDEKEKKIQQVGLTTDSWATLEDISNKVDAFNRYHKGIFVQLDYMETPPHEMNKSTGRWRLLFTFANRDAQRAFWLGNF